MSGKIRENIIRLATGRSQTQYFLIRLWHCTIEPQPLVDILQGHLGLVRVHEGGATFLHNSGLLPSDLLDGVTEQAEKRYNETDWRACGATGRGFISHLFARVPLTPQWKGKTRTCEYSLEKASSDESSKNNLGEATDLNKRSLGQK